MAEFVGTAVIFTIVGVLIGLAWNYGGPVRISEPKDFEDERHSRGLGQ
jgi:hypothetical protein